MFLRQYRTDEVVDVRVNFSPDSIAEIEGLLDVNRDFCKMKMAKRVSILAENAGRRNDGCHFGDNRRKKAPHSAPPKSAVSPELSARWRRQKDTAQCANELCGTTFISYYKNPLNKREKSLK